MKASAIIVAAGAGTRLGLSIPKAFVTIDGISLLMRVLATIRMVEAFFEVVIAVPSGAQSRARDEANAVGLTVPTKITEGGAERQDSVRLALKLTSAESELVVVHDAARPFATPAMFSASIAAAARSGAAILGIPLTDTLKRAGIRSVIATLPRENLWLAQTPQAFRRELLLRAHQQPISEQVAATDDAHLCERLGAEVEIVPGSPVNLKITTAEDLRIAQAIAWSTSPR